MIAADTTQSTAAAVPRRHGTLRRVWDRPGGRTGAVILGVLLLFGLASAVHLTPYGAYVQDPFQQLRAPSLTHPFGTDGLGRDLFSRVQSGVLLSILIACGAVAICTVLGTLGGIAAGYLGRWVSAGIMGLTDLLFAIPSILLALAIVTALGQGPVNSALAVGIAYTPIFVRVVRSPVLAVREADYVRAARVLGFSPARILLRHVLPAVGGVLAVQVTLALGWAVLTEASLSFLGLGPRPPAASLGLMVSEATSLAAHSWWVLAFPAVAIALLVISFNLLGDALRDALDPTGHGR